MGRWLVGAQTDRSVCFGGSLELMSNRTRILQTARALAVETGSIPSLDDVAEHAGVSKGGLMYHFRSRAALTEGVAMQAIEEMDQALAAAAERGQRG